MSKDTKDNQVKNISYLYSLIGGFLLLLMGLPGNIRVENISFLVQLFIVGVILNSWILFLVNKTQTKKQRLFFSGDRQLISQKLLIEESVFFKECFKFAQF